MEKKGEKGVRGSVAGWEDDAAAGIGDWSWSQGDVFHDDPVLMGCGERGEGDGFHGVPEEGSGRAGGPRCYFFSAAGSAAWRALK